MVTQGITNVLIQNSQVSDTTPQSPNNTYSNDRLVDNSDLASTDKGDDDSIMSEDDEDDILSLLAT